MVTKMTVIYLREQPPAYVVETPDQINQAREEAMDRAKEFVCLHDADGESLYIRPSDFVRFQIHQPPQTPASSTRSGSIVTDSDA